MGAWRVSRARAVSPVSGRGPDQHGHDVAAVRFPPRVAAGGEDLVERHQDGGDQGLGAVTLEANSRANGVGGGIARAAVI